MRFDVSTESVEQQLGTMSLVPLPRWKRAIDVMVALAAIIAIAPALLLIVLAIRLDSAGGAFYVHRRVGRAGRTFNCWKFRSMYRGADQERISLATHNEGTGHIFKMRHDPRVTRVGRILRRTSMDELPQLWNVLRGEMSLVGPRPPLPEEVAAYSPRELLRLTGTPGVTGLWQVTARARHDFNEMVDLDLEYLDNLSIRADLAILVRTVRTVVRAEGSY